MTEIKKEELRLSNKITDIHGRILTVHEIKQTGIRCVYNGQTNTEFDGVRNSLFQLEDIGPIPLTPEILEKAGFAPSNIGHHITVENKDDLLIKLYLEITKEGNEFIYFKRFMRGEKEFRLDWEIKYLHQLQNVFYFITGGQELEITL